VQGESVRALQMIRTVGHNRHGPKIEGLRPFCGRGAGSPSNTMSFGLRLIPPYQVASWSIQPFGYKRYGTKIGGEGSAPFWLSEEQQIHQAGTWLKQRH